MSKFFKFIPEEVPENLRFGIKSIPEEKANMISHGIGFVIFLVGSFLLINHALDINSDWYLLGVLIFSISLLMVYTFSTLYHSVYQLRLRQRLRVMDHISIYFLIAGSFAPFILVFVQTTAGWVTFSILWAMVLIGSVFKYFYTHKFKLVSTLAYVCMGALSLIVIEPLKLQLPEQSFLFLQLGLASYLLGVPFYLWKSLYQNHLIWHLFVLGGSILHFLAVFLIV